MGLFYPELNMGPNAGRGHHLALAKSGATGPKHGQRRASASQDERSKYSDKNSAAEGTAALLN